MYIIFNSARCKKKSKWPPLTLTVSILLFNDGLKGEGQMLNDPFENIVGNGENAGYQHFLLFPQYFHPIKDKFNVLYNIHFVVCKCFQFD